MHLNGHQGFSMVCNVKYESRTSTLCKYDFVFIHFPPWREEFLGFWLAFVKVLYVVTNKAFIVSLFIAFFLFHVFLSSFIPFPSNIICIAVHITIQIQFLPLKLIFCHENREYRIFSDEKFFPRSSENYQNSSATSDLYGFIYHFLIKMTGNDLKVSHNI